MIAATCNRSKIQTADIPISTPIQLRTPAQVHNWINENGESRQQAYYFHCDQIGIQRVMTDKDGLLTKTRLGCWVVFREPYWRN